MMTKRDLIAGAAVTLAAPMILKTKVHAIEADTLGIAVDQGIDYLIDQAAYQSELCGALTQAIARGDMHDVMRTYGVARAPYEEIEVHAGAFADLDAAIDARPYAFKGGEANPEFAGFHRIEQLVFRDHDLAAALPVAQALEQSIAALGVALTERARFSPSQFFEGLIALPEEVGSKKISSEEEAWSDLSLVVFRHNFVGVQSQFAGFLPALREISPDAADRATLSFLSAHAVLEPFFEGQGVTNYSDVRTAERRLISQAAYNIRDAMEEAGDTLGLL